MLNPFKSMLKKIFSYFFMMAFEEFRRANSLLFLHQVLNNDAVRESADFVKEHLATAMVFKGIDDIRSYAMSIIPDTGLVLEVGVASGQSINFFSDKLVAKHDSRAIYGIDGFEGLSEDYTGTHFHKGSISYDGNLPPVRENVVLIKGWVEDTLEDLLEKEQGPVAFVHVDVDTYGPTKFILEQCKPRMQSGALVLFDELICHPSWKHHEFKALNEVFRPDEFEYVAFSHKRALIRIL